MDKATITKLRNMDAQLKAWRTQLIEVKEDADYPTDKHHLEKARKAMEQAQKHLKVAVVGLQDQINNEKLIKSSF